jgi:hypothetical protein
MVMADITAAGIIAACIMAACITVADIMVPCITVAEIMVPCTGGVDITPVITVAAIIIRMLDTFGMAVGTSMASVPAGGGPTITMSSYGFAAKHLAPTPTAS